MAAACLQAIAALTTKAAAYQWHDHSYQAEITHRQSRREGVGVEDIQEAPESGVTSYAAHASHQFATYSLISEPDHRFRLGAYSSSPRQPSAWILPAEALLAAEALQAQRVWGRAPQPRGRSWKEAAPPLLQPQQ